VNPFKPFPVCFVAGMICLSLVVCSGSVVVITSALHAEGREFNPRPEYCFVACASSNLVAFRNPKNLMAFNI
jgi:hypothetical protein